MCARREGKPTEAKRGIKIRLILLSPGGDKSEIRLIRTDTTLDLSQKAEKRRAGCLKKGNRVQIKLL